MKTLETLHLHCRCGSTALTITAAPVAQLYCHCDDCRSAHAAAYVAESLYPAEAVEVTGLAPEPVVVKATRRMRCPACSTHLFSEIESAGLRSVNAFLLPAEAFTPQLHIQCQHAILPVADNLPHYKGFPPAFGGTDERVEW